MSCGKCETDEEVMAATAGAMGHSLDHLLIKIPAPLDRNVVSKLGNSLIRAQQRLAAQAERLAAAGLDSQQWSDPVDNLQNEWDSALRLNGSTAGPHFNRQLEEMEQAWQTATSPIIRPPEEQYGAQCFNCRKSLQHGPRFICANCPLGQLTPGVLGLNLCADCEKISQELHDPSHFFIKIQSQRRGTGGTGAWTVLNAHAIARLRARTGEDIEGPLLPILYRHASAIATGPPVLPTRVRVGSSSTVRRPDEPANQRSGDESDDERDAPADAMARVAVQVGPSTSSNRAWPLPYPIASTLAMARSGKFSTKTYQRQIQGAIRAWIKDTTDEFEMHRFNCRNRNGGGGGNNNASGSGANGANTLRSCLVQRASRWLGCEETGTKSPAYVPINDLVHPSILCDSCYECIEGAWYRCCSCKESFDLCSRCEGRVDHDSRHVFAVFKQPVDMALFKSLIDHATEVNGHSVAARPMLPVLLVGEDE
ncbi:hypothetical protein OC835_004706 [Tilletia horrida]|nr:hypothetical protein OC835_004706 [Tilletia horrida]